MSPPLCKFMNTVQLVKLMVSLRSLFSPSLVVYNYLHWCCLLCVLSVPSVGLHPVCYSHLTHQFNLNYIPISHLLLKLSSTAYILPPWWIVPGWIFSWAVNQSLRKGSTNGCDCLHWMKGAGQVVLPTSTTWDISSFLTDRRESSHLLDLIILIVHKTHYEWKKWNN